MCFDPLEPDTLGTPIDALLMDLWRYHPSTTIKRYAGVVHVVADQEGQGVPFWVLDDDEAFRPTNCSVFKNVYGRLCSTPGTPPPPH